MGMNRLHALAVGMIVACSLAAAPATKPVAKPANAKAGAAPVNADGNPTSMPAVPDKLPPLQYRAKADAPAWVAEYLKTMQASREKHFERTPKEVKAMEEKLEVLKKSPINPKQKAPSISSSKGTTFNSAAARDEYVEAHRKGIQVHYALFTQILNVTEAPAIVKEGKNLQDFVEPIPVGEQAGQ